jgi:hypothetical protein
MSRTRESDAQVFVARWRGAGYVMTEHNYCKKILANPRGSTERRAPDILLSTMGSSPLYKNDPSLVNVQYNEVVFLIYVPLCPIIKLQGVAEGSGDRGGD